jgi:TatD DNase family protein
MYVDFHTHLHSYPDLVGVSAEILRRKILSVGCSVDVASYVDTKAVAATNPFIVPTFGVHPMAAGRVGRLQDLDEFLDDSKLIGEIGLDNCWFKDVAPAAQERVFESILDHCHRTQKFCVVHTKDAEQRVADILAHFPGARPIIHWYDGPTDVFETFLARGYPSTFGCEVHYSERIRTFLRMTPAPLLLTETDNPDSEPWLGGTNGGPDLIHRVVDDVAAVRGREPREVEALVEQNSLRILRESGIEVGVTGPSYAG